MREVIYTLAIVSILTTGCLPTVQKTPRIQFPLSEYESLNTEGSGVVKGQAFLKTRGGDVKTAAGNEILLNPVTSYSNQWYNVGYQQNKPLTDPDPRYDQYILKTIADADGEFEFTDVPPGAYYLVAPVFWEAPTGYQGSLVKQGGFIAKKIVVENDKEQKHILTR